MAQKLYPDATAASDAMSFDGMPICAGGFGLCGIPERLIDSTRDAGTTGPTIAGNDAGIHVQRRIAGSPYDKRVEFRTVCERVAA